MGKIAQNVTKSNTDEIYVKGGGEEFLILKYGPYWECRDLRYGDRYGPQHIDSLAFERETAIGWAKEAVLKAICKKTNLSEGVARIFMEAKNEKAE